MNFNMTKIAAALALAVASQGAYAVTMTSMNISDTINNNATALLADDTAGTDGKSGSFRFAPGAINLGTYAGATMWNGDVNSGVINMAGGAPLDFTTGFIFTGAAFQPFNSGAITASTSAAADAAAVGTILTGADLNLNIAGWAGFYTANSYTFNLTPDAGSLVVNNLIKTGVDSYAYRASFMHNITTADDPSLTYTNFTAQWVIEGTVAAPVPEASTYGMMLSGLGLVGAVVARRRRSVK